MPFLLIWQLNDTSFTLCIRYVTSHIISWKMGRHSSNAASFSFNKKIRLFSLAAIVSVSVFLAETKYASACSFTSSL